MMFSILADQFLFLQTVFLLFQLEQPIAVANSYFLRIFLLFSRLFFTLPDDKLLLQFLGFVLIDGISGCLRFLGTQLHFKGASCASQMCLHRPSSQASSSQAGKHFLCQYFPPYNQVTFMAAPISNPSSLI